jgi:oxygen-independent coproporphyrinogen III oxidase
LGCGLPELSAKFGVQAIENLRPVIAALVDGGLMEQAAEMVWLTPRGRLLSNEVFERFILADEIIR